jgi:hypothetical protein
MFKNSKEISDCTRPDILGFAHRVSALHEIFFLSLLRRQHKMFSFTKLLMRTYNTRMYTRYFLFQNFLTF